MDAALFGHGDPGSLALFDRGQLCFSNPEEHPGHHTTDGAGKVDLLGDGYDTHALFAPIAFGIDPLFDRAGEAVQFPDHNRIELAIKYGLVQRLVLVPVCGGSAFGIFIPGDFTQIIAMGLKPGFDYCHPPIGLLGAGRNGDRHVKYGASNYSEPQLAENNLTSLS